LFGYDKSIIDLNTEIPEGALDLGVAERVRAATSQPRQFAATIAVRAGDRPTAQKSEPTGKS